MIIDLNKDDNKTKGRKNKKIIAYVFFDKTAENIFQQSLGISYLLLSGKSNCACLMFCIKFSQETTFLPLAFSYACLAIPALLAPFLVACLLASKPCAFCAFTSSMVAYLPIR